jgi:hypothetical protein
MAKFQVQRRVPRFRMPRPLHGRALSILDLWVVDLSVAGARIRHSNALGVGSTWTVELPPELGSPILSVRIVWTMPISHPHGAGNSRSARYESGVEFVGLTEPQQAALSDFLRSLSPGRELGG